MKRFLTLCVAALSLTAATAQDNKVESFGVFDHLGADVTVGLDGLGLNLAAPVTDYLQIRAGVSYMPKIISYTTDIDYTYGTPTKDATVTGKVPLEWINGKLLFDVYPIKDVPFRISLGGFFGTGDIIKAYNTTPVLHDPGEGVYIGDVLIQPDANDNTAINARVWKVKPYFGLGYGYDVPKSRVGFTADLGLQMWGSPTFWVRNGKTGEYVEAQRDDFNESARDALDFISKLKFLPVLSLGVAIRLF